jgi:uncharacterized protein (DUF2236 family)
MSRSEVLTVGAAARGIAGELLFGRVGMVPVPHWYRAVTAAMLPQRLRDGFALRCDEAERARAERALARLRRLYPLLPAHLHCVAPYHEAMARLAGRPRADTLTRLFNRFWIGRPAL